MWFVEATGRFAFDDCELDLDRYELRLGGAPQPVEPQVFKRRRKPVSRQHEDHEPRTGGRDTVRRRLELSNGLAEGV